MAVLSFTYKALDANGAQVAGNLSAADRKAAFDQLTARGLSPYELKERAQRASFQFRARAVTNRDLERYVRQLATLLSANVLFSTR